MNFHTPGERRYTINDLLLRVNIRQRALLYTSYRHHSITLQREDRLNAVSQEDWRTEVRRVELYLMLEEKATHLIFINLTDWEPRYFTMMQVPSEE